MADYTAAQGQLNNIVGALSYNYSTSGETTLATYTGEYNDMYNQYLIFRAYRWATNLVQDVAGVWNLSVTIPFNIVNGSDPSNEVPTLNWELDYDIANKSLLDLDNPTVNNVPTICAKAITDAIKEGKIEILDNRLQLMLHSNPPTITSAQSEAAYTVYFHMAQGIKTWPVEVPVLIKSCTSSNSWVINWSQANRGKIFSTNTLIAQEPIFESLIPTLNQFQDVYVPPAGYPYVPKAYGWLKGGPKTSVTTGNRNQINQKWTYGLWATMIPGQPL